MNLAEKKKFGRGLGSSTDIFGNRALLISNLADDLHALGMP